MPEFPNFDQIARQIIHTVQMAIEGAGRHPEPVIAEQLRQVWNARGAADLDALEPIIGKLGDTMDPDNARVFVGDALRTVDR
jgi:hypothetical protein